MKRALVNSVIAILVLASSLVTTRLWAETQGVFRGEVVRAPRAERQDGLLYLMGRDGNVRRVVMAGATVEYDSAVSAKDHLPPARRALVPGTEVRVTVRMDAQSGEWTASRVEVIAHHAGEFEDDYGEDGSAPDPAVTTSKETSIAARTL